MSTASLALAAHLIGVILWIGGGAVAATIAAAAGGDKAIIGIARKAAMQWSTPGLLLAWAGGLTILIPAFTETYASMGWMHAKLTLLLALSGVHGVLSAKLRKAASGEKPASAGLLNGFAIAMVAGAAIVVFLAVLKPF